VLRSADRFVTLAEGIRTAHCFSFGTHFDPLNVGFGALQACNDEQLEPRSGYPPHRHLDTEIVTWVVSGTLTHEDSTGSRHELPVGAVQRLSAGSGVEHAERNEAKKPLRFVQMWLRPDTGAGQPAYACDHPALRPEGWTDVVGGDAAMGLGTDGAVLRVARLTGQTHVVLLPAPQCFVFVATGSVAVDGSGLLEEGDALMLGGQTPRLTALEPAQVLAWALPAVQAVST
jgi:redox-sensitive bicupin YhaK (pirin superfamily)